MSYIIPNGDKSQWQNEEESLLGIRRSSRLLLVGMPNSGKTTKLLDLIAKTEPPFSDIFIKTLSPLSNEYGMLDYTRLSSFTDLQQIDPETYKNKKVLIIFEDCNKIPSNDVSKIEVFLSFFCSHFGFTCVILTQTAYALPVNIRRLIDQYIIFGNGDVSFLNSVPINKEKRDEIKRLISRKCRQHDYFFINLITGDVYFNLEKLDI